MIQKKTNNVYHIEYDRAIKTLEVHWQNITIAGSKTSMQDIKNGHCLLEKGALK